MLVPPGSMQYPMFHRDAPLAFNYGSIGSRIANAMVHSIDAVGRMIGNASSTSFSSWWSDGAYEKFKEEKQCFKHHYGNMTAGPYDVNGESKTISVSEIGARYTNRAIARSAGLRIAFQTFQRESSHIEDMVLPGLNMTSEQFFFLSAVQTRCE